MPSIINSDDGVVSGTSGLKSTGGNDGLLNIQSNGSTVVAVTGSGISVTGTVSQTGVSTFAAGTVSAPSITFTGDTNTGIFSPAADTIAFTEGGTEAMRINSSGNVLVGTTTSPSTSTIKQVVADTVSAYYQFTRTSSSVGGGAVGTDGSSILIYTHTGNVGSETYTERMRINSSGGVQFNAGISVGGTAPASEGSGVKFPATQVASSDANTLDDYEEGTWTPVLNFGGSAGVTTYAQQNGTYTKVGNTVTVRGYFVITTKSAATGNAALAGFPFATKSGTAQYHTAYIYMNGQSITGAPMCYINPNATNAELGQTNGSTGFVNISNTNFSNGGDFIFQATYLTA